MKIEYLLYLRKFIKMKKYLFLLATLIVVSSCKQEKELANSYEIIGKVNGIPNGVRVFIKSNEDKRSLRITDTAIIKNEQFIFKGTTESPLSRGIYINSVKSSIPIILENGKITINVDKNDISKSTVTGTKNNELLQDFVRTKKLLSAEKIKLTSKLRKIDSNKDKAIYDKTLAEYSQANDKIENHLFNFVENNPDSEVSLMALSFELNNTNINFEKFKKAFSLLDATSNRYPENKKIANTISNFIKQKEATANLEIGKIAPKFSSTDPDGKLIALDDIKGKVTIIDFWAAWCGPCRRENPNVVKVYEKYHDKGLEIIGVSLDGNRRQKEPKAAWLKAIEDDKLNWHHVSSLQYFNDPVAKLYSVNSIPRTFILDEDGRIVAKNLRGKALEDKIAQLLN